MKTVWFSLGLFVLAAAASPPNPVGSNRGLESWTFPETRWFSYSGHAPLAFTNVVNAPGGAGNTLEVDSINPAFIQFHVIEPDNHTNLLVDHGSLTFWFRPHWSSADQGGYGPGDWARLLEVGSYSTNAGYGWWSVFLDPSGTNLFFSAQDEYGTATNFVSAPVSWFSNDWHFVALTYSATNSSLYLDGQPANTNGLGVTLLPGVSALANGFFVGSDSNGWAQAHGQFDELYTYNYALPASQISGSYSVFGIVYYGTNWFKFMKAPSSPILYAGGAGFNAVGGLGWLQPLGPSATCTTNVPVYLTDVSATVASNTTTTITFTIAGGTNGVPYDVFGATDLGSSGLAKADWTWLGQGYTCNTYRMTNQPNAYAFYVLGTPQDVDFDGLTDAYELLVSKTNPLSADANADGIPEAWAVLNGLDPLTANLANLDPDVDVLANWQEYLYGTKPLVSEGFSAWISLAASPAGIP